MLDEYLNSLEEEEKEKTAAQARFGAASVTELAKLAGIKLAEDVCTNCGDKMEKSGSIMKCGCGMMKKAFLAPLAASTTLGAGVGAAAAGEGRRGRGALLGGGLGALGGAGGFAAGAAGRLGISSAIRGAARTGELLPPDVAYRLGQQAMAVGAAGAGLGALGGGVLGGLAMKKKAAFKGSAAKKKGTNWGAVAAMPPATAAAGAAIGAMTGALQRGGFHGMKPGAIRGGLAGGAVGAGVAGLIGLGALLGKADPSGKTLETVLKLAPAAGTAIGVATQTSGAWGKEKDAEFSSKLVELIELNDGDLEKTAAVLEEHGMSKEAIGGILSAIGAGAKGVYQAAKGVGKAGPRIGVGQAVRTGASGVGEAAKQWGKGVAQTAQKGYTRGGGGVKGVMRAAGGLARQNPGATLALGAMGGYGASKLGSAILEVGDAAGRLLAKTAEGEPSLSSAPIPLDEIRESIQEAQSREDIPGRARRAQIVGGIGGGIGGGLGGAALGGAAHFLSKGRMGSAKIPMAIGGGLGVLGGAAGGQYLGKDYGAEEARADKAVAMLRALRAHQAGAMSGYGAGMQRGYDMGRGPMQEKTSSFRGFQRSLTRRSEGELGKMLHKLKGDAPEKIRRAIRDQKSAVGLAKEHGLKTPKMSLFGKKTKK